MSEQFQENPEVNKPKRTQTRKVYVVACVIAVMLISGISYWYWTNTPQYSLRFVPKAFEEHDLTMFEKYVDMDSLISRAVDQVMDATTNDSKDTTNPEMQNMVRGIAQMFKPMLATAAKEQIKTYIEKGNFDSVANKAGKKQSTGPEIDVGDKFFKRGGGDIQYKGVDYSKKDGKIAVVGLKLYYPKLESEVILEIKMRERDGYWQIMEINNLSDFIKKMDQLEKVAIDKLNAPIIAQMQSSITTANVQFNKRYEDQWGISRSVNVVINFLNLTPKSIVETRWYLLVKDRGSGQQLLSQKINTTPAYPILGNKERRLSWKFDNNKYSKDDQLFWDTPNSNMQSDVKLVMVKFEDGSKLELLDKIP